MYDYVHIDEKWYNLMEETSSFYMANDEPNPNRQCTSKKFIPQVMFLAAVGRPRYTWDGKIGA